VAENRIPLPALPRELAALTGGPTRPYARLYRGAVNGEFPVIVADNGRYFVDRASLSAIADAVGLTPAKVAA
jgi:hypothetical protein